MTKVEIVPALGHFDRTRVAFSPDGRHVLTCCHRTIKLWEQATGRLIRTFCHEDVVICFAFSSAGGFLIAGSGDVRMWEVSTGKLLHIFKDEYWLYRTVVSVTFSPDGCCVLAARNSMLDIWDTASGELLFESRGLGDVDVAAFSRDGALLVVGGLQSLALWSTATGTLLRIFKAEADRASDTDPRNVQAVAFSADGAFIVSAGLGRAPQLWDVSTGRLLGTFQDDLAERGPRQNMTYASVVVSPDGAFAITSGSSYISGPVKLWDLPSGRQLAALTSDMKPSVSVALSPHGRYALAGSGGAVSFPRAPARRAKIFKNHGMAELWDLVRQKPVRRFQGHVRPVTAVAFSGDGGRFATSSYDAYSESALQIWDARTGRLVRTIAVHGAHVTSVALSYDGTHVLGGGTFESCGRMVKLWDVATGRWVRTFEEPTKWGLFHALPCAVSLSHDGVFVVCAGGEDPAKLFDAATGRLVRSFEAFWPIALSPDGTQMLSGPQAYPRVLALSDVSTGEVLRRFDFEDAGTANALAFSPDRTRILMASSDGTMRLWDIATGQPLQIFDDRAESPTGQGKVEIPIYCVAFSSDGTLAVSGGADGKIKLWNAAAGTLVQTWEGHAAEVNAIAMSPDGTRLLSAGNDSTIRMWSFPAGELLVTFVPGSDEAWLALTPAGFFAGAVQGNDLLNVVAGLEVCAIEPFFECLHRPDLVAQRLTEDPDRVYADAAAALDLGALFRAAGRQG